MAILSYDRTYAKSQYGRHLGGKGTAKMAALHKPCVSPVMIKFSQLDQEINHAIGISKST
jgi:hypothetical protein